jgi:RNA polymerase sigma factor (sigma-70 family)
MVFSIAYRFLRDRAVAEELAQDVFLKLYRELPRLQSPDHVKFWLRKVISHRAMDHARSAHRRHEVALGEIGSLRPARVEAIRCSKLRCASWWRPYPMRQG